MIKRMCENEKGKETVETERVEKLRTSGKCVEEDKEDDENVGACGVRNLNYHIIYNMRFVVDIYYLHCVMCYVIIFYGVI